MSDVHSRVTFHCFLLMAILLSVSIPVSANNQTNFTEPSKPLYCYQCNSRVNKGCSNLTVNSTNSPHYKNCTDYAKYQGHKPFCRKIVQTIHTRNELQVVIRKCSWLRHKNGDCYTLRNYDRAETVCQCFTDGCNTASVLRGAATGLSLWLTLGVTAVCFK